MSCGVGHRRGSDPTLLWLWYRLAATALIQPLAWEPPYASCAALKLTKRPQKKKEKEKEKEGKKQRKEPIAQKAALGAQRAEPGVKNNNVLNIYSTNL